MYIWSGYGVIINPKKKAGRRNDSGRKDPEMSDPGGNEK